MKKTIILLTFAATIGVGSYVVFAKEHMSGMMGQGGMMDSNDMMMQKGMMGKQGESKGMMGGGMMGGQMMGMHPMSGMMGGSSLAATGDGGVVVLMGNKLFKYDKDLNLVKEVEIKADWESMNKTMMQHQKMMMGGQSK